MSGQQKPPTTKYAPLVTVDEVESLNGSDDSDNGDGRTGLLGHGLRRPPKLRRTGHILGDKLFSKSVKRPRRPSPAILVTDAGGKSRRGSTKTVRFDSSIDLSFDRDDETDLSSALSTADSFDDGYGESDTSVRRQLRIGGSRHSCYTRRIRLARVSD